MSVPRVGRKYRLKAHVGNQDQGLHLQEGWIGKVLAIVEPVPGEHEGGVVVAFPQTTETTAANGEALLIETTRNWSCTAAQFADIFQEVK